MKIVLVERNPASTKEALALYLELYGEPCAECFHSACAVTRRMRKDLAPARAQPGLWQSAEGRRG